MKRILSIIVALIVSFSAVAQNPVGVWEGKLNVTASASLRLIIEITQDGAIYNSKLISVDQGNAVINGVNTTVKDGRLLTTFSMISAQYKATISEAELNGTFTQAGQQFPLIMTKSKSGEATKINRPQTPKAPYPYNIKEVTFTNHIESNMLSGTLTIPNTEAKVPAVVLVSGSGSQNRDSEIYSHKPFWIIADYLSRNGIAVLRFDDRNVGKSGRIKGGETTADIAYDAEAGVEYLRSLDEFSSVGVIGHSEGGTIAFILAGDSRYKTPDFIVSMAGCGVSGVEILNYQNDYALSKSAIPEADKQKAMATNRAIYNVILNSKELNDDVVASVRRVLEDVIPANVDPKMAQEQVSLMTHQTTSPWAYHFIKFDPRSVIEDTKCPVLAINGSLDRQVSATENLNSIKSSLDRGGNKQYEIVEYKGLNHLFQKAESGAVAEYGEIE
ncbi:MAG: alpha/beta hydrolase, partial [Rikenellaceae bacterium]